MSDKIYGRKPVLELLRSGNRTIHHIHILTGAKDDTIYTIEAQAKAQGIPVSSESKHKLDQLVGHDKHQGVVASCAGFEYASVRDLIDAAQAKGENLLVVALDELEDPQNLGAILRTCEAAGVHGVLIPRNRTATVNPTVVKVSAGAADNVLIAQESNINEALRKLKDAGAWVVGADAEAETEIHQYDFSRPTVIVIGSEGKGLRRLVREHCDTMVKIPMYGKVSSLNASVSAALLIYEAVRRRRWEKPKAPAPGPILGGPSWGSPSHYGQDAAQVNEFYESARPGAPGPTPSPPPDRSFFLQALIRTLKRRLRATRMRG